MESALFGARRAVGLLQQFRRLSLLLLCSVIVITTIQKSCATRHTSSCPVVRIDLHGVVFSVGTLVCPGHSLGGTSPGEYKLWRRVFSCRGTVGIQQKRLTFGHIRFRLMFAGIFLLDAPTVSVTYGIAAAKTYGFIFIYKSILEDGYMLKYIFKTYITGGVEHYVYGEVYSDTSAISSQSVSFPDSLVSLVGMEVDAIERA